MIIIQPEAHESIWNNPVALGFWCLAVVMWLIAAGMMVQFLRKDWRWLLGREKHDDSR